MQLQQPCIRQVMCWGSQARENEMCFCIFHLPPPQWSESRLQGCVHCVSWWPHRHSVFTGDLEARQLHINMHSWRDSCLCLVLGLIGCAAAPANQWAFPSSISCSLAWKQTKWLKHQQPTEGSWVRETCLLQHSKYFPESTVALSRWI